LDFINWQINKQNAFNENLSEQSFKLKTRKDEILFHMKSLFGMNFGDYFRIRSLGFGEQKFHFEIFLSTFSFSQFVLFISELSQGMVDFSKDNISIKLQNYFSKKVLNYELICFFLIFFLVSVVEKKI